MKRTTKYQLGYFEEGDTTSSSIEMQRWETLDAQLYSLFSILGNGVISGWNLLPSSGLSVAISSGSGHVNFVSVQTTENVILDGLVPNSRNYIYAVLDDTSYWNQTVEFSSFLSTSVQTNGLLLGYIDTNATAITAVNMDDKVTLGFISTIINLVKAHRHIGGENNPSPVNLSTDVQGIINQNNLPDIDASIIKTGTISSDRLPLIDHITKLTNQGTLTHAQIDSFIESLSLTNPTLMGETSTIDLLQLVLALKHIYPDIDKYLINEIAYIPGISPDSYVDWDNTTATVDINTAIDGGQHTITGSSVNAKKAYTYTWDSETEFKSGTYSNLYIDGDNACLETEVDTLVIDEFSDISKWEVVTDDMSSLSIALASDPSTYVVPPSSAKLVVGDTTVEITLSIKKEFDAQDWSAYSKIVFYLKTTSVQHGDVYFYINDLYAKTQNSHTKILNRNEPTVNIDTLQNGWQEVTVDISSYTRTNINTIGFYVSSQQGWDTSKGFDLNLDNIYLTTGNKYKDNGYLRVIFGGDTYYDFWRLRWNALIPTDSSSSGLVFKGRTRVGNTLADLSSSIWSAYTSVSGTEISLPAPNLYKYIEIEMYFGTSTDLSRTAYLKRIDLDFYTADVENSFVYDDQDNWQSGNTFNIDTTTVVNSMLISKTEEVNDIFYGSNENVYQLDDNLTELYNITGTTLPRSTYQVLNSISPSLGLVGGVARGNNGNIWIADIDNDRIVEVDKSGALIRGFYGSFLSEPIDPYGTEDAGPGSNTDIVSVTTSTTTDLVGSTTTSTTTLSLGQQMNVLQAVYNPSEGILYVVFDQDLENIYDPATKFDINKIYLKIGSHKFYLNDSTVELLGVDETKYNNWHSLSTSNISEAEFISQFKFTSHVLKIKINGADKTLLSYMVDQEAPSIVISSPYEQQRVSNSITVKFLLYNFVLGTASGQNAIRVTLDGGTPQDIFDTEISYGSLASGVHTIHAQLKNADGSLNTNVEAIAQGTFVVNVGSYSLPYISISSPKPNQIYSSSPIVVDFSVENFPILSTGQHVRYIVDSGAPVDYYSEDPITISNLTAGKHTINIYLVDKWGSNLGYTYGSVTATFIVGNNSNAVAKLYTDTGAIYNLKGNTTNSTQRTYLDVGNVYFTNIYSPIDIQMIPADTSAVNPDGLPTVLVAKLRSPSWLDGLSDISYVNEFNRRLVELLPTTTTSTTTSPTIVPTTTSTTTTPTQVGTTTTTTTTLIYSGIETPELIYGTRYLDGHSVVQLDMKGEVLMSNNAALFAPTKLQAKDILGSAEKLGDNEILIADAYNKRAIITNTDLDTEMPKIEWQYDSDRYVSDFHIVIQDNVVIDVRDDAITNANVFIRQGTNIIWENNSVSPISIYSGTTTYDTFQLDPDLDLYGDVFASTVLQPGERYTYKFLTVSEYDWFVYPSILTGKVTVTRGRLSSRDKYIILENDGLESPFTSRVLKVNNWGVILWSFGEGYLVKPRDSRPLLNNGVIIST